MMKKIFLVFIMCSTALVAQVNDSGVFIDPNKGQQDERVSFNLTGNQVESIITNWGSVGNGNASVNQAGVWPRGTGHGHIHEMTGIVVTRTKDQDGNDVIIVSDGYAASSDADDIDPNTNIRWKYQPLPGYFNREGDTPEIANSRNPNSWPTSWPDKGPEWDGAWNGYFGLNQFNADQEVFYVMDDLSNTEYSYYPIDGSTYGGLGLQIRVRLFQWSQALAKDILFMQYEVSNISDQNYTTNLDNLPIIFGGYTDVNPAGSGATDDAAAFDKETDIVYGWSKIGQGTWTQFRDIAPGYVGWKFLESPGIEFDAVDNDGDGLIDESRDNDAGIFEFGSCGVYADPMLRWSGDEDCDWNSLLDDVGTDGIGSDQEGYPGPDADGTEGNGKPDQGEPNFGRLDNDESDQVGLTSFFAPAYGTVNIHNEETVWPNIKPGFFDVPLQGANQIWIFGSGPFALPKNKTQRFSTCFVFGANEIAMLRSAQVAQRIFDSDYRFATPPRQPDVRAIAGDGKVTLVWDDLAEISRDPIYGKDFEGYRIIKSTDPQFTDAEDITDAFGNAVYKRSIAQFDKRNGLTGYHVLQFGEEIGVPNGVHYYMGDDTGLQHSFIDEDVVNGRTYYYAVLSYDAGYDTTSYFRDGISKIENLLPISPSESPASITVTQGVITNFDRNTVQVRPNPKASDYISGEIDTDEQSFVLKTKGLATGSLRAEVVDDALLKNDVYTIVFHDQALGSKVEYRTASYSIVNAKGDSLIQREPIPTDLEGKDLASWNQELIDEGIIFYFNNTLADEIDTQQQSSWSSDSKTNLIPAVRLSPPTFAQPVPIVWPIRIRIEIGDGSQELATAYTSSTGKNTFPVYFRLFEQGTGATIPFIFSEVDSTNNGQINAGELIQIAFKKQEDRSTLTPTWNILFESPKDANGNALAPSEFISPTLGDVFELNTSIPFSSKDAYVLNSTAGFLDNSPDKSVLDEITVVPNPYVAANVAEAKPFLSGRGERRIEFRNLPEKSVLRIYSASGVFIRELIAEDGLAVFDLQSEQGLEVAFGLYFYHLTAPKIGEKIGKFAIIN
jgi:hypothetical protein